MCIPLAEQYDRDSHADRVRARGGEGVAGWSVSSKATPGRASSRRTSTSFAGENVPGWLYGFVALLVAFGAWSTVRSIHKTIAEAKGEMPDAPAA